MSAEVELDAVTRRFLQTCLRRGRLTDAAARDLRTLALRAEADKLTAWDPDGSYAEAAEQERLAAG